ncbi:hypothetical protein HJD18_14060 [Thermoleophilia bacterium SCSIO 60948]|nr:hypothetical protein HJD18_14060 [Thermoleophilia bacterium SCSIO 60948]
MRVVRALIVFVVFGLTAAFAPAALAQPCEGGGEQAFLDWGDNDFYVLAGGGDFESELDGWQLRGGAEVVSGGNVLRPQSSAHSLSLPDGSSAVTAPICVTRDNPVARMFSKTTSGLGLLRVQVIYLDHETGEEIMRLPLMTLNREPRWDATQRMRLTEQLFDLDPETGRGYIQLRFAPLLGTDWKIDDVLIDPRRRI